MSFFECKIERIIDTTPNLTELNHCAMDFTALVPTHMVKVELTIYGVNSLESIFKSIEKRENLLLLKNNDHIDSRSCFYCSDCGALISNNDTTIDKMEYICNFCGAKYAR